MCKRKQRVKDLALEPMVFCYSDIWLDNFILDQDAESITVIDFSETAYLPSCFAKFALATGASKINRDIRDLVTVPTTEGVDNTEALYAVHGPMIMGPGGFERAGNSLFGHQPPEEEVELLDLTDENGDPVVVQRREGEPPPRKGPEHYLPPVNLTTPFTWPPSLPLQKRKRATVSLIDGQRQN